MEHCMLVVDQLPVDGSREIISMRHAIESQGGIVAVSVGGSHASTRRTDVETLIVPRARNLRKVLWGT